MKNEKNRENLNEVQEAVDQADQAQVLDDEVLSNVSGAGESYDSASNVWNESNRPKFGFRANT